MSLNYGAGVLILGRIADPQTAVFTKAKKNNKEAILYHTKILKRTDLFRSMDEVEKALALEEEKERVKEIRWKQGLSGELFKLYSNSNS